MCSCDKNNSFASCESHPNYIEMWDGKAVSDELVGRIYVSSEYYKTENGISYVAVSFEALNSYKNMLYHMSNADISKLKVGDVINVDHDTSIKVSSISIDNDWDDPSCPHEGTRSGNETYGRNQGIVIINNHYFFVHPQCCISDKGKVTFEDGANSGDWILYEGEYPGYLFTGSDASPVSSYDIVRWMPVDEDTRVLFKRPNDDATGYITYDNRSVFELPGILSMDSPYYVCDIKISSGVIREFCYVSDI